MCGRYTLFTEEDNKQIKEILRELEKHPLRHEMKTGEIFPTNLAPVITGDRAGKYSIQKWGFQFKSLIINARAETIHEKRTFMGPIRKGRILVPATGFYEWDEKKGKHHYTREDSPLLYMAGISNGSDYVIITTAANESVSPVHERMPLIIDERLMEDWLYDDKAYIHLLAQQDTMLLDQLIEGK